MHEHYRAGERSSLLGVRYPVADPLAHSSDSSTPLSSSDSTSPPPSSTPGVAHLTSPFSLLPTPVPLPLFPSKSSKTPITPVDAAPSGTSSASVSPSSTSTKKTAHGRRSEEAFAERKAQSKLKNLCRKQLERTILTKVDMTSKDVPRTRTGWAGLGRADWKALPLSELEQMVLQFDMIPWDGP